MNPEDAKKVVLRYGDVMRDYAEGVVSGEILACKWIRLACQATLDDLDAAAQSDAAGEGENKGAVSSPFFPWRFDPIRAFRACALIESLPHVKGPWASRGEKLLLSQWQVWITASIFGWVNRETGRRRYRRALVVVPRKSGKSAFAAGIGLYMAFADGDMGAEVYSGATSERQAHEVFAPARLMVERTPALKARFGLETAVKRIISPATGSKFEPVVAKPGDGSSPSCAIVDEYHEHETDQMVETFRTGMGARENPLLFMISTAGDNLSGPCYAAIKEARAALTGAVTDDHLFAALYGLDEGDDWTTDEALVKANPNYGVSVSPEFLKAERDAALKTPRRQGVFKTKHLNKWVGSRSQFFNMENWRKCADESLDIEAFEGLDCYIGLDLGSVSDISAVALLFPPGDHSEKYAVFGRSYLPDSALSGRNRDRYQDFLLQGRLIVAGENMVDQDRIEDDIREDMARFTLRSLSFDPWNATAMISRLQAAGAPAVEFQKRTRNVSMPMKQLAGLIDDGLIIHDGDEAVAWMVGNVESYVDSADNVRAVKANPDSKIDFADALIAAFAVHLADEAANIGREPRFFVA
ncbi:MAG: terminase TerL endonuclease subunit [Pseudomonadota bacterium]